MCIYPLLFCSADAFKKNPALWLASLVLEIFAMMVVYLQLCLALIERSQQDFVLFDCASTVSCAYLFFVIFTYMVPRWSSLCRSIVSV